MARVQFPEGFHWGAATASYQIEGASRADGKGEIDLGPLLPHARPHQERRHRRLRLRLLPPLRRGRRDAARARAEELPLLDRLAAHPADGRGRANQKGLDYYRRLVDALLAAGIRPFPTLYHWDLPQALEDAAAGPNRDTASRFADYAETWSRALGDRVQDWLIFNEPHIFTTLGYLLGIHAPGLRDLDAFLRATHTVNLAQGEAVRAMRASAAACRIGSAFNMSPCEPATDSAADRAAAERWHALHERLVPRARAARRLSGSVPGGAAAATDGRRGARHGARARGRSTSSASTSTRARSCAPRPRTASASPRAPLGRCGGNDGPAHRVRLGGLAATRSTTW